ncbi:MAG: bifunctional adenosylcobinamide kinase/adenosylcobinamide-phosphate guanylyltransferase [Tissierellia bacterium]|jgi:adenosylcobinamide kinase/adenosylcobinamide-phosphate guanylyltransferase|nr:bifunctional adenosylcobinamide kinase/adenosylcobinamide-phosphate guanylyltransferase [Tissierellia bacterium]
MLELILGGARSGKSSYAENKAQAYSQVLYLATAQIKDEEMEYRIKLHRKRRPEEWITLEKYKDFEAEDFSEAKVVLIDCLTLMVTGIFFDEDRSHYDDEAFARLEDEIWLEIENLLNLTGNKDVFIVSNEIGLGLVPEDPISRVFRDMLGRFHQRIALRADKVSFIVAGIAMVVK